jgi:proteasome lid subunit RPN8/RPN11
VVRWEPADAEPASGPETDDSWDLFMSQELLLEVREHLAAAPEHEAFGFLVGRLYYCPWTKSSYVLGDGALKSPDPLASGQNEAQFRDTWHAAWKEARGQDAEIVGWYHRHGLLGVQLSQHDVELHKTFFPEAWQSALVLVLGQGGNRGGFVRRKEGQLFFNRSLTGFYELADPDVDWTEDVRPTVLDWDNHSAENRVRLLDLPELPDSRSPVVKSDEAESGSQESRNERSDEGTSFGPGAVTAAPVQLDARVESVEPKDTLLDTDEGRSEAFVDAIQPLSGYDPIEGSVDHSETLPEPEPTVGEAVRPEKATPERKHSRSAGARLDPTDPDLPVDPSDIPLAGPEPEPVETRHEPQRVAPDHPKRESPEEAARPGRRVERQAPTSKAPEGLPFLLEAEEAPHPELPGEATIRSLANQIDEILALSESAVPEASPAPRAAHVDSASDRFYDYNVPIVMPSPDRLAVPELMRQHWKLAAGAGAVVLIVVVMILRAMMGQAPTDPAAFRPAAVTAYNDIQFQQLGRAVARQIVAYDERRADFELGRIDCASLALGHTEISQAFAAYSERFAVVGTRLPAADRMEYQRLASEATAVTRHFEQAGCASE